MHANKTSEHIRARMTNGGAQLAVGDVIGSYRVIGHLVGSTYRAVHVSSPRRALIEIGALDSWRETGVEMLRAQRLVESMQHPGIARIVERGMLPDRRPWMITDVPSGIGLYDVIGRRAMPTPELITLIRDVADVLAYAHALGVVHRALTFRSIVLATGSRPFPIAVTDWGRAVEDLGVFGAPELSTAAPFDGRVDVYALGVIAFRAATGNFPGEGGVFDVSDAPVELAALISRMLAIDPNDRPSASQVRQYATTVLGEWTDTEEFIPPDFEDTVLVPTPRFAKPRWTPSPDVPITSERAPTASGEITKKHS